MGIVIRSDIAITITIIIITTLGGSTWQQTNTRRSSWLSIVSDISGQYLAAVNTDLSWIWISTSGSIISYTIPLIIIITIILGGSTWAWVSVPSAGTASWSGLASDSTGQYLAAIKGGTGGYGSGALPVLFYLPLLIYLFTTTSKYFYTSPFKYDSTTGRHFCKIRG